MLSLSTKKILTLDETIGRLKKGTTLSYFRTVKYFLPSVMSINVNNLSNVVLKLNC